MHFFDDNLKEHQIKSKKSMTAKQIVLFDGILRKISAQNE